MIKKFLTIGMFALWLAATAQTNYELKVNPISIDAATTMGYSKGVSAVYAGMLGDKLIVAGGCNFPNVPAADGGAKVFYADVFAVDVNSTDSIRMKRVGHLPEASAYGVTVATDRGLLLIGGATKDGNIASVWHLSVADGKLNVEKYPELPYAVSNMSGVLLGRTIYVVGGSVDNKPSSAVFALNLDDLSAGWHSVAPVPGKPRTQSVCAAQNGRLYVWGGFAGKSNGKKASLSVDGYSYNPETGKWKKCATPTDGRGHKVSLGGGAAVATDDGKIVCVGGVNKDIFLQALQGKFDGKQYLRRPVEWYQFNDKVLEYDCATNSWSEVLQSAHAARAGAALVRNGDDAYIIQGEIKPGIRILEISTLLQK